MPTSPEGMGPKDEQDISQRELICPLARACIALECEGPLSGFRITAIAPRQDGKFNITGYDATICGQELRPDGFIVPNTTQ